MTFQNSILLAELLGISRHMVNKLRKRGIPVDSLAAAQRYLNPFATKEGHIGGNLGK